MKSLFAHTAVGCLLAFSAATASGHKASDSYLTLAVSEDGSLSGHWDIALRDLEDAIGLDADQNGEVTWAEVRARHDQIARYALSRLTLHGDSRVCTLDAGNQQIDDHTDGAYTVIPLSGHCPDKVGTLSIDYRLLFDIDAQHRGLLRIEAGGRAVTSVLGPDRGPQHFALGKTSLWQSLFQFVHEGIFHIWSGFDHLLFLVALLLPSVLVRSRTGWQPASDGRKVAWNVAAIVTAFTFAHSVTLALAVLGVVTPPSRWVESLIAFTVIAAAIDNVRPFIPGPRWSMAFLFGLVHGFGFASVLVDLELPRETLLVSLIGFNAGVELGQLAVVGTLLPLAFLARGTTVYPRQVVASGSFAITIVAAGWFIDRAFDFRFMPF